MAYGTKYQASFDSASNETYTVSILEKDYVGAIIPLMLSGVPIKHNWQTDEAQPAIKGSSLVLNIINTMTPITVVGYSSLVELSYFPAFDYSVIFLDSTTFVPQVGVPFTISGHPDSLANNTWTPTQVTDLGGGSWNIHVADGTFTTGTTQASATISVNALTGVSSIAEFYSNEDNHFKVQFYRGTQKLFEGFLVQDDCSELMVDYIHEISLSFNDNLGLLKDIALNENIPDFAGYPATAYFDFVSVVPDNFIYLYNTNFIPAVSVPFTISGHIDPSANAAWTPTAVTKIGSRNWKVQVADFSFIDMAAWPCFIAGPSTIDLYNRNTLLNIIRVCLYNTGLELNTHIYANIFETTQDNTRSFLEQTYIDTQTFIKGENFDNCYSVLTDILDRYNLTLFQANGVWNIVRWQELRYYSPAGLVPYFEYDSDMEFINTGVFNKFFTTGFQQDTYPENGLTRSIFRPYKFDKETFNYKQPKYLLKNFDLQNLGALITSYTSGSDTYTEYEFTDWDPGGFSPQPGYFTRVVTDTATGDEKERYVVVEGATGDTARSIVGQPFEVSEGDKIELSFTFRTTKSQAGAATVVLAVKLYDGTTTKYADEDPSVNWKTGLGWNYSWASGTNSNTNQSVTINPGPVPFDGLIYCYLPQATLSGVTGTDETQIKDIRLTYTPFINDSIKIIGHVHNSEQDTVIKNNEAIEINIDDAPRNSIAGTLFKPTFASLIQDRTLDWYRITNPSEELRIGEITTLEQEQWRQVSRTKLEGTFYGLGGFSNSYIFTGSMDFYMLSSPDRYDINLPGVPPGVINVGDIIVVSGSASNNGSFTVIAIQGGGGAFPAGSYLVQEPIVTEPGATATVTVYSNTIISMLAILTNTALPGSNFIFGSLEIEYKNNNLNCTIWEIYVDGEESETRPAIDYTFTYLYDSK